MPTASPTTSARAAEPVERVSDGLISAGSGPSAGVEVLGDVGLELSSLVDGKEPRASSRSRAR